MADLPVIDRTVFRAAIERGIAAADTERVRDAAGWLRLRADTASQTLVGHFGTNVDFGGARCPLAAIGIRPAEGVDWGFISGYDDYLLERLEKMGVRAYPGGLVLVRG